MLATAGKNCSRKQDGIFHPQSRARGNIPLAQQLNIEMDGSVSSSSSSDLQLIPDAVVGCANAVESPPPLPTLMWKIHSAVVEENSCVRIELCLPTVVVILRMRIEIYYWKTLCYWTNPRIDGFFLDDEQFKMEAKAHQYNSSPTCTVWIHRSHYSNYHNFYRSLVKCYRDICGASGLIQK